MQDDIYANHEVYHIFNRSIAGFKIFNNNRQRQRFIDMLDFYSCIQNESFSYFSVRKKRKKTNKKRLTDIIAYCVMPTHYHLILGQKIDRGISVMIGNLQNSYTRYFNILNKRKGPLWESKYKHVHIETNEQLLHLTRYIHLNPVSAGILQNPFEWKYSSIHEYVSNSKVKKGICDFSNLMDIVPINYKQFVIDRISIQKEISKIKYLIIESYTG